MIRNIMLTSEDVSVGVDSVYEFPKVVVNEIPDFPKDPLKIGHT